MFSVLYWNPLVCLYKIESTTFCQSAGGSIMSHSVTALDSIIFKLLSANSFYLDQSKILSFGKGLDREELRATDHLQKRNYW